MDSLLTLRDEEAPLIFIGSPLAPMEGDPGWPRGALATDRMDTLSCAAAALKHNIAFAEQVCAAIIQAGAVPFAPHLLFTRFLDDAVAVDRELGMRAGRRLLITCDEAWFCLPPWRSTLSTGMVKEQGTADAFGTPSYVLLNRIALDRELARLGASPPRVEVVTLRNARRTVAEARTEVAEVRKHLAARHAVEAVECRLCHPALAERDMLRLRGGR